MADKLQQHESLVNTGIGTIPSVEGLSVKERGNDVNHKTVFTFVNVAVALTDEPGVVAYGGKQIYDFPAGIICFEGAAQNFALTKSSAGVNADWDGDVGLGTVTASNNGTLASTEQNVIPTTATPQAVAGVTTADALSTQTEHGVIVNGSATPVDLFLNFLIDDADHNVTGTACNLIVNGELVVFWKNMGDIA